jgi:fatty acid desaturase
LRKAGPAALMKVVATGVRSLCEHSVRVPMTSKSEPSRQRLPSAEWPTVGLALVIYATWILTTLFHTRIGLPLTLLLGAWTTAWHNSLQHEVIHGHPTRSQRLNTLLAIAPLSLWLPFESYRRSHLAHHRTEHLTDPDHDPESRYPKSGEGAGGDVAQVAYRLQSTLSGRLILGPPIEAIRFLAGEAGGLARGDLVRWRLWGAHAVLVAGILVWLTLVCRMSLCEYVLCFVYPGAALSLIRSFAEHQPDLNPAHRVAIVEDAPVLGLLFLNNNLHAAHHDQPSASWYRLPSLYRRERGRLLAANGGLVYAGYAEVFRRYWRRPQSRVATFEPVRVGGE